MERSQGERRTDGFGLRAAEFGFDYVRFLFRPDGDTDEADDDAYAREQQERQAAAGK